MNFDLSANFNKCEIFVARNVESFENLWKVSKTFPDATELFHPIGKIDRKTEQQLPQNTS